MAKLSIITINYNNLEGLKRTIESVVNQTWHEFEFIVIDGGSTDGSTSYIKSQSEHVDYWVSEPDKGVYNAMNKGILKATGEYLLFLNSGDHFFSHKILEENHFKMHTNDLIYFNVLLVNKESSTTVSYPEKLSFSHFYFGTLCHQSVLIKRQLFNIVGLYDENLMFVSDWKFFILALFKFNCSYQKVDIILTTYYLDGISSSSTNKEILQKERHKVLHLDFKNIIEDFKQFYELRRIVSNSRKIQWLVKLGLLKKM